MGVKRRKFSVEELGCIGDGSFGHDHIRTRLADLCDHFRLPAMAAPLRKEMSDDGSEEDDAITLLNRVACAHGVRLAMVDGDLVLVPDTEDES